MEMIRNNQNFTKLCFKSHLIVLGEQFENQNICQEEID